MARLGLGAPARRSLKKQKEDGDRQRNCSKGELRRVKCLAPSRSCNGADDQKPTAFLLLSRTETEEERKKGQGKSTGTGFKTQTWGGPRERTRKLFLREKTSEGDTEGEKHKEKRADA